MIQDPISFTVVDPRTMDGDPYEVAARAVRQAQGVADILTTMLGPVEIVARNAEMERNLFDSAGEEADAEAWSKTAQAKGFQQIKESLEVIQDDASEITRRLATLAMAAEFNPKEAKVK